MPGTGSKLLLLVDQTQVSIEERNRLIALKLEPSKSDDAEIERSLHTIRDGMSSLQMEQANERKKVGGDKSRLDKGAKLLDRLMTGYGKLLDNYGKDSRVNIEHLEYHPPNMDDDEEGVIENDGGREARRNKSVRFKDSLVDGEGAQESFITPYRDNPDEEEEELSDNGMYQQQQQAMREQDQHLDRLSQSVSRQRDLSIQIDDELSHHIRLLDEVDELTDRSQSRLDQARKGLEVFSRKARENGSMLTIGILLIIFIILVAVLK
ncbi:syntaxin-8 [Trichomonascus vanleenenianus]|uniref:syntaxin n=1 Tax=Trichomonascus vanleenenianus TaxID=2268995 RepID=UPI003ECA569D